MVKEYKNTWRVGIGTFNAGIGVEVVELFFSGEVSEITPNIFYGQRIEANFGAEALGKFGLTATIARNVDNNKNYVLGIGFTFGLGASGTVYYGDVNFGRTERTAGDLRNLLIDFDNKMKKK